MRVVLISGPSSSGKTTFRKRLEVQLYVNRLKPVGISLDDYFIDREHTPLDEFGEKDYESLYAIDLDLFEKHVIALLNGEEIELPSYNFVTGQREFRNHRLVMDNKSVLIVEGIHALNPKLTEHISLIKVLWFMFRIDPISLDTTTGSASRQRCWQGFLQRYRGYSAQEHLQWEACDAVKRSGSCR